MRIRADRTSACQRDEKISAGRCRSAAAPGMARRIVALRGCAAAAVAGLLIRRRRGGALAHDFLGLGRRRRRSGAASSSGAASGSGAAAGCSAGAVAVGRALLALGFRACFDFGSSGGRSGGGRGRLRRSADRSAAARAPLYNSFGTPCSRPGTPSGKTGLRSPGSFFLVSRKSSRSVGSQLLKPPEQPASAPDSATGQQQRSDVASGAWSISHSTLFRRQLFATGGSNACSASARERRPGGVSPSLAIRSSHCRAAVVSLARQADSASSSRAVWRKVAPGAGRPPQGAAAWSG